jgi:predicted PurR-regulated permease PerM
MPPAVLLSVQLLAAGFLGFWGLVLAAPLTAAAQVLIEEIHFKRMDRRAEGDVESVENEIPPLDPAHAEGGHIVRSA